MKKVLFIGLGHMGSSLVRGILANPQITDEIYGYDAFKELQDKVTGELKTLKPLNNITDIASENIDTIVIGTRPDAVEGLCNELKTIDLTGKTIVSMANAVSIEKLSNYLSGVDNLTIIRMMPNMNASLQQSVTAIAHNGNDQDSVEHVITLFESCGIVELVDEAKFGTLTAISGCLPAYVFTFFKAITDYAVEQGFDKEQAFRIVETAIIGSVRNGATSGKDLQTMIDQICVPNGSTIEGQKVLEQKGFGDILKECLKAADKKASH